MIRVAAIESLATVLALPMEDAPRQASGLLFLTLLAGLLQGLCIALVAHGVSTAYRTGAMVPGLAPALTFLAALLAFVWSKDRSLHLATERIEQGIAKRTERLVALLRAVELRGLETIGQERIQAVLTRDLPVIANASVFGIHTLHALAAIGAGLLYIGWVSPPSLFLTLIMAGIGGLLWRRADRRLREQAALALSEEDGFFSLFRQALAGFPALKLDPRKRRDLIDNHLRPAAWRTQEARVQAGAAQVEKISLFNWLYFPTLATIAFVLPRYEVGGIAATLVVLVLLWLPALDVLASGPHLIQTRLSRQRLRALEKDLAEAALPQARSQQAPPGFQCLTLEQVVFRYTDSEGRSRFDLGPVDLTFAPGQINLIMGENGSGKSTLLKLIAGLYPPQAGRIQVDGQDLIAEDYRGLFAAVFADFHLFRRLYGLATVAPEQVQALLVMMRLADKVSLLITDHGFAHLALAEAQRRRLAMIAALLEDRPIYLFDEWTADQDPAFRRAFYRELLPTLKAAGKCVICATHDGRYRDCADRVLVLARGQILTEN